MKFPKLRQRVFLLLFILAAVNCAFASDKLSPGRWVIYSEKPAREWEHGMVTGNGRHGARVMGMTDNERIIINHEELFVRFWDRRKELVADIARLLPKVRSLIDEGKEKEAYALANAEAKKQLTEKGRIFRKAVIPHPDRTRRAVQSGRKENRKVEGFPPEDRAIPHQRRRSPGRMGSGEIRRILQAPPSVPPYYGLSVVGILVARLRSETAPSRPHGAG